MVNIGCGCQTSPGEIVSVKEPSSVSFTLLLLGLKVDNTGEGSRTEFSAEPPRD